MESTERQLGTPRPSAASRMAFGTISSISSVVRRDRGNHHDAQRDAAGEGGKMLLAEDTISA